MGIFGAYHTEPDLMDYMTGTVPNMASQLRERYGERVHSEYMPDLVEPYRTDTIEMGGKEYAAEYFGKQTVPTDPDWEYLEYWRLEDAFEDAAHMKVNFTYMAYDLFPMKVEDGQALLLEGAMADGSKTRWSYRADGSVLKGETVTVGFDPGR